MGLSDMSLRNSSRSSLQRAGWLTTSALVMWWAAPASAETLQGALAKAYENNPTLTAARAGQRANDENVPIQKAGGLPNVGSSVDFQENLVIPRQQLFCRQTFA